MATTEDYEIMLGKMQRQRNTALFEVLANHLLTLLFASISITSLLALSAMLMCLATYQVIIRSYCSSSCNLLYTMAVECLAKTQQTTGSNLAKLTNNSRRAAQKGHCTRISCRFNIFHGIQVTFFIVVSHLLNF